jgi:hypothetical protein
MNSTYSRIPLEQASLCIDQVSEPGGRRSCYLTSQLNALIVRDAITADEALYVQETVVEDPAFDNLWIDARASPM